MLGGHWLAMCDFVWVYVQEEKKRQGKFRQICYSPRPSKGIVCVRVDDNYPCALVGDYGGGVDVVDT